VLGRGEGQVMLGVHMEDKQDGQAVFERVDHSLTEANGRSCTGNSRGCMMALEGRGARASPLLTRTSTAIVPAVVVVVMIAIMIAMAALLSFLMFHVSLHDQTEMPARTIEALQYLLKFRCTPVIDTHR